MSARRRVLLADDHRMVAEALRTLLEPEFELVGIVEDGRALIEAVQRLRPDVIVADISMPHLNGIDALVQLKRDNHDVRVVLLTMHKDVAYARRALEAGALGYVLKHSAPAELVMAVNAALEGRTYITPAIAGEVIQALRTGGRQTIDEAAQLTPRQREILQLVAEGCSAKAIATRLDISPRTVEFHKYQMMEALKVQSSAELIHFAIKHGIVATCDLSTHEQPSSGSAAVIRMLRTIFIVKVKAPSAIAGGISRCGTCAGRNSASATGNTGGNDERLTPPYVSTAQAARRP